MEVLPRGAGMVRSGDGVVAGPSRTEVLPMPKPVPMPIRQAIWERSQRGEGSASLATAFDLSPRTVRHLVKRSRDRGRAGLATDYRPPPPPAHARSQAIRRAVLAK